MRLISLRSNSGITVSNDISHRLLSFLYSCAELITQRSSSYIYYILPHFCDESVIFKRKDNSFSHLMSGKRYTTVSTKTHTPSTKCQYISPATIAQWFFGVKSPRRERINRTDKKMRPTKTCEACRPVSAKKDEPWREVDGVKS